MFASLVLLAAAQISIPLGRPKVIEQPKAPIEKSGPLWASQCKDFDDWDKAGPPVRIHGNAYYVGTCGISAILITGSEGHILIDGTTEAGAEVVARNIARLGFNPLDIRYILVSHEHFDHVGGVSALQQRSKASLLASPRAAQVFTTGRADKDDPQAGMHAPFPKANVDGTVTGASCNSDGVDGGSYAAGVVSGTLSNIAAGVTRTLVFRVTVN